MYFPQKAPQTYFLRLIFPIFEERTICAKYWFLLLFRDELLEHRDQLKRDQRKGIGYSLLTKPQESEDFPPTYTKKKEAKNKKTEMLFFVAPIPS